MKKNIALLAGGYSGEYDISVQSAATVARHLDETLYRVFTIFITKEDWYYQNDQGDKTSIDKNDFSLILSSGKMHFDAVFFCIHGSPGEDGRMQGYFDLLKIPYTGCGVVTSALTFNKSFCNRVVAAFGDVKVAPSLQFFKKQSVIAEEIYRKLKLPVFVKPAEGGSSLGISKVSDTTMLDKAIQLAFETDKQILVEEFIKGRELSCGVYMTEGKIHVLPLTEVKTTKDFFNYEAKYTPGMAEEITPAPVAPAVSQNVQKVSETLYQKLDCRGIVRFDYILENGSEKIYFLEINTMPGQSPGSIVPKQIRAAKLTPEIIYNALLKECFAEVSQ